MLAPWPLSLNVVWLGIALFSAIAVAESNLFTVSALNVVAPVIDTAAAFPNTTVEVPAEKTPLFIQFPKRTIFAELPAPVTTCVA